MPVALLTLLRAGLAIHWFMSPGRTLESPVSDSADLGASAAVVAGAGAAWATVLSVFAATGITVAVAGELVVVCGGVLA